MRGYTEDIRYFKECGHYKGKEHDEKEDEEEEGAGGER